jgi:MFS family permease
MSLSESLVRPRRPVTVDAGRSWWLVAPALFVLAWGGNQFTPLLLMYRRVDGYSAVQVDVFLAVYVAGLVPGFLLCGPISDRFGRKRVLVSAVALGALASGVLALGSSSPVWLSTGRLLAGASVAGAMVVGTAWIEELSSRPNGRPGSGPSASTPARRASLTLTTGLGAGALVAGTLAQWGPAPGVLPYAVQIVLCLLAGLLLLGAPETRTHDRRVRRLREDLRIPRAVRRRFCRLILPMAPWVFGAASLAYALTPTLVVGRVGSYGIAFATLLTVITLGVGAAAQQLAAAVARWTGRRVPLTGLLLCAAGVILCAVDAATRSVPLAVASAGVLGAAYGLCLVSGLVEVRKMADTHDLGGLTGIYYGLTYSGFVLPAVLAGLSAFTSYSALLVVVALVCVLCAVVVATSGPVRAGGTPSE